MITVTQVEDGGWWEGTLKDKTGWFPSNYVKEYKAGTWVICKMNESYFLPIINLLCFVSDAPPASATNTLSKSSVDLLAQQVANRSVIVKDLIDSERAHVIELDNLVNKFLVPINCSGT